MPPPRQRADCFRYEGYSIDPARGEVRCTYSTGGRTFVERYQFDSGGAWNDAASEAAVRLLFLLAGVSYYKTTAAPVVDLGSTASSAQERAFLTDYFVQGLGEFAYRNGIDLGGLTVIGSKSHVAEPASDPHPVSPRPLIPFGGGMDSIVTACALRSGGSDAALCIVHPPGHEFAAIEDAAAVTKLPIIRVAREIDTSVRHSAELGFLNGHVPITAVITAAALVAAVLDGRDAVILSNEWSASVPTLVHEGRPVNHQWSKGIEFEQGFSQLVAGSLASQVSVFSYLRSRSELWVAQQFAHLSEFHGVFRSCNHSFHQDRAERLGQWCGSCDKCCFIDLILSPFMGVAALSAVFAGHEPLEDSALGGRFLTLLGVAPEAKPFECVGDVSECRAAVLLAAERPDRQGNALLQALRAAVTAARESELPAASPHSSELHAAQLLAPIGPNFIPERYAPPDLLVRAQ